MSQLSIRPESALGVVIAAEGYPGSYPKGWKSRYRRRGRPAGHQGVSGGHEARRFPHPARGGRVLCVTALGKGLAEAQKRAYEAVAKIDMEKSQHRSDIGAKG